ncbi:MAG: CRTAC1 family protein [Acidobacteria bacterium]|nr:CRTAC1 family protein [Acidobacteriota bacterium]
MAARPLSRRALFAAAFASPAPPLFEEIPAAKSGIRWIHNNARSLRHDLPESLGPGVAFIDYDNDGWPDLFFVNSGPPRHALYRNNRDGTFTDVTAKSGIAPPRSFGMGAAIADFNNDGFPDIFLTAYGRPVLYRNNGNGTFTDVTAKSGIEGPSWSTSAVWFDYNGDGLLDLFVCGFVEYDEKSQDLCIAERGGRPGYCIPRIFQPSACRLYRNNGDGTFTDVSRETGIAARPSKALGVVTTDCNNDGLLDLFVANDTVQNFLFVNGGGRFEDKGVDAMVAFSESGWPRSGMGVDSADIDGDGWQDLLVTNIDRERFSLYRNTRHGVFDDLSFAGEIGRATYNLSGWGCKFFDADNDGGIDLLLANGHPDDLVSERSPHVTWAEPLLFFQSSGGGALRNRSAAAGPVFQRSIAARGLAAGDYNNDGRLDFLVGVNGGAPLLLKNNAGAANHWAGIKLKGITANRDGIGAKVTWSTPAGRHSRLKTSGGSYLSSHDPREILGLGPSPRCEWVEVRWPKPSNRIERFEGIPSGRYTVLEEGAGRSTG